MAEAKVMYDYEAVQDDELNLKKGQTITDIYVMEDGWWEGEVNGQRGLFPDNFVELLTKDKPVPVKGQAPAAPLAATPASTSGPSAASPATPAPPTSTASTTVNGDSQDITRREGSSKQLRAKVVYSYHQQNEDEISLTVGDVIDVTGQPEDGWWEGTVGGHSGLFPSNFVNVIEGKEAGAADKENEATREPAPEPQEPPPKGPPKARGKGPGFGNIFASGEVKLRKTEATPLSGAGKKRPPTAPNELAQKRLSLKRPDAVPTPKPPGHHVEAKPRPDPKKEAKPEARKEKEEPKVAPAVEEEEFEEIVRERARVTFPYEAQHSDELELKDGDIVTVLDKEAGDNGWWFGEVDGRKGVFPDNFVTMLPPEKVQVRKKPPAALPARPTSMAKPGTKPPPKPALPPQDGPAQPRRPSATPDGPAQPRRPSATQDAPAAQPKAEPPARKPQPSAGPKPPKKALPAPIKKPKVKPPPPKPSGPPPDRDEAPPPVILRHRAPEEKETKEPAAEGSIEDIKSDSAQKLTHITLSRPKNTNKRPPSVFGGQGVNLSEATPMENGTAAPPPRPKFSPIGPTPATGAAAASSSAPPHPQPTPATKKSTETSPAQSPATSRPASVVSEATGQAPAQATNAQVEELKKEIKTLQDQVASMKSEFKKEVVNLMSEVDEEKKLRMAMQVELDRIKKLVLEKN